jgi:hypothetical protein
MKKIIFVSLSMFAISCGSNNKEKDLVSDYLQTMGDTKIDLKIEYLDFEKEKEIRAKDSIVILKKKTGSKSIDELEIFIKNYREENKNDKKNYNDRIDEYGRDSDIFKNYFELFESSMELEKELENNFESWKKYDKEPEKVLVNKFKIRYSIINPMLNNAKQELKKIFFINPESTKVSEEID